MGWTKYAEDNYEISYEREREADYRRETSTQVFYKTTITIRTNAIVDKAHDKTSKAQSKKLDLFLLCKDCGNEFVFPVGSQKFFEKQGWTRPIRCKRCRENKKARFEKAC